MDQAMELNDGMTANRRFTSGQQSPTPSPATTAATTAATPQQPPQPSTGSTFAATQRNRIVPLNDDAAAIGIGTEAASSSSSVAVKRRQLFTQPSTVATRRQQAICVRRAQKQYGSAKNPNVVLDGLNMTVPKGCIYGLLGASGCGKTTLLSCIVGRRRLDNGEIWVLGGHPGTRGSGVPGPRIGYMPQELALYTEFTLRETLIYFGWVTGMTTSQVDARMEFLCKMLQLPASSRFVNTLSGGQQRRVSLAAALLNEPELLILDEPTVGVDPLIRNNIWEHLVEITSTGRQTVIITTHYIEETRQAHLIGLMRGGRFLAEESPEQLLQRYSSDSLEDVFLKLAIMQNKGKRRRSSLALVQQDQQGPANVNTALDLSPEMDEDNGEISGEFGDSISLAAVPLPPSTASDLLASTPLPETQDVRPMTARERLSLIKGHHVKALIWKNFLWMWRNPAAMTFIVGLPMLQIIIFCLAIGHDPTGLKLAVCNHELNRTETRPMGDGRLLDQTCAGTTGCNYTLLSCRYLGYLHKRRIEYELFDSEEAAFEEVRRGLAWGSVVFAANYSESLLERSELGRLAESWTLDYSLVNVRLDQSNQQIAALMWRDLQYVFFDYIGDILSDCEYSRALGAIPVRFEQPVYGARKPDFTDFAAPGIILTVVFFLAVALTSGAMIIERNEGMLERCLVSGISVMEILIAHMTTQFVIVLLQVGSVLLFSFPGFQLTMRGPAGWMIALVVLTGFCGMCYGFVVSAACNTERTATYLALGSFLPIVMLCGIIWPIEGMWPGLKLVASLLPLTQSVESLRSITQRGWGMDRRVVWVGFASTGAWVCVFLTVSIVLLKFRKQ